MKGLVTGGIYNTNREVRKERSWRGNERDARDNMVTEKRERESERDKYVYI